MNTSVTNYIYVQSLEKLEIILLCSLKGLFMKLLGIKQAANSAGISQSVIRRLIKSQQIE